MATVASKVKFVLLADDDDDDTMLFVEATEKLSPKVKVSLAGDGQKLLSLLEMSPSPDIIFLDLNMPRISGLECLKTLRKNSAYDNIPVIMYSTSQNKKDIDESYNSGASYYVVKPYDFEDIISILQKLFSKIENEKILTPTRENFLINTRSDGRI